MSDNENHNFLFFDYKGSEYTPDKVTRYLSFNVKLYYGPFSGETEFETTARSLEHFVKELNQFSKSLNTSPKFIAGRGEDLYFSLTFSKYGLRGHVLLECELRQPGTGTNFNSVHAYQSMELNEFDETVRSFQWVLDHEERSTITIG